MTDQPSLFDAAQQRQEHGITRASSRSGEQWIEHAKGFVFDYLHTHTTLFCDDVWAAGLEVPESPRAFGAVMKHALREGWMVATGEVRRSHASNNSWRTVYRSTLR